MGMVMYRDSGKSRFRGSREFREIMRRPRNSQKPAKVIKTATFYDNHEIFRFSTYEIHENKQQGQS